MAKRGVNKVIIVGNLGNEPDLKHLPNGDAVALISVATSEVWKDKASGEQKEKTEWHRIIFFRRLAEIAGEYLKKGSKVYVEGKLQTRKWQGQDGQDRYTTEIVGDEMQMLDMKGGNGANSQSQNNQAASQQRPAQNNRPAQQQRHQQQRQAPATSAEGFDDDIPF